LTRRLGLATSLSRKRSPTNWTDLLLWKIYAANVSSPSGIPLAVAMLPFTRSSTKTVIERLILVARDTARSVGGIPNDFHQIDESV